MAIKLFETIKKVFMPEETNQVSSTDSCCDCGHIQIVDEKKLQEEGNTDNIQVTQKNKRNNIYNRLEEICAEYRMDLETLKKMNFLEEICGKSLETLNETDVENLLSALQTTLHFDFKAFWKDRDENDIAEIMQKTKRQYNRDQVGATRFGQAISNFRTESSLKEELVDTGIIDKNTNLKTLSDEDFKLKVRQYFNQEIIGDTKDCSEKQLHRKYNRARKQFVYFINKFQTPKEKELLAAAVAEMDSDSKAKLTELLVNSCGCDLECRGHVAKSAYDSIDTTAKDAFGKTMTQENATSFYEITYSNMNKSDLKLCAQKSQQETRDFMKNHSQDIKNIKTKLANGIQLESWEEDLMVKYNNAIVGQTAGASVGIPQNTNITPEEAKEMVGTLLKNAADCEIDDDVLETVAKYVDKNPEKFAKMSKQEFTQMLDEITDGKYSQVLTGYKAKKHEKNDINKKTEQNDDNTSETVHKKYKKSTSKTKENSKTKTKNQNNSNETVAITVPEEFNTKNNPAKTNVRAQESFTSHTNQDTTKTTDPETSEINKTTFINKDITSYIRAEGKVEGVNKYIDEFGKREGIAEAIDNIDQTNKKYVERLYKQQNSTEQLNIIRSSGTDLNIPLAWTDDSTILKLDGEILSCHYATKQAKDAIEEIREG